MPLVSLLRERLFERQLELISQAYTCLPLERAAAMLGCSVDDAEKGVCVHVFCKQVSRLVYFVQ